MDEKKLNKERLKGMLSLMGMTTLLWVIGIFFFYLPIPAPEETAVVPEETAGIITDAPMILIVLIATLGIVYFFRKTKYFPHAVAGLLGLLIYNTLRLLIDPLLAALISILIVYIERSYRSFATNNALVLIAVFAGTMPLAIFYTADFLVILLVIVSIYDIFGVLFTQAIPKVAIGAAEKGMPLLILSPKKPAKWFDKPSFATSSAILGAGDIFIPLLFITAVSIQLGIFAAFMVLAGALLGNAVNLHLVMKTKRGIPAMPLLAIGMIAAYYLVQLFS